jgi:hypothetical protein
MRRRYSDTKPNAATDRSTVEAEPPTTDGLVLGLNEMPAVPAETVADNSPNLGCGPD